MRLSCFHVAPKISLNIITQTLDSIHVFYEKLYKLRPFSFEFTDKTFEKISIEIYTDSLKYIYGFNLKEKRLNDTLRKYNLDVEQTRHVAGLMQSIHCTWVNNLDYYVAKNQHLLTFMSIRPRAFYFPFTNKKYYIITYFSQPQYFDKNGILFDNRRQRQMRRINNDVFRRINDKVAYTISDRFR
ncbi:MAG: hypothetical protein H0W12_02765 [Chitinophagaceae bacterium]|nr:hypothetical protein [Chitinophagaceae bacterium]